MASCCSQPYHTKAEVFPQLVHKFNFTYNTVAGGGGPRLSSNFGSQSSCHPKIHIAPRSTNPTVNKTQALLQLYHRTLSQPAAHPRAYLIFPFTSRERPRRGLLFMKAFKSPTTKLIDDDDFGHLEKLLVPGMHSPFVFRPWGAFPP